MTRPLVDRLAEAMREARIGDTRFAWQDCDQDDWRRSAAVMLKLATKFGIAITVTDEKAKPEVLPETIYQVIGHNPSTERLLCMRKGELLLLSKDRKSGDETTVMSIDLAATDTDADQALSGNPSVRQAPAILTRLAASSIIRKLHAETL